ncbi:hypothetical protein BBJ28_00025452, partial [Nothophytophthora sp. Chile5]
MLRSLALPTHEDACLAATAISGWSQVVHFQPAIYELLLLENVKYMLHQTTDMKQLLAEREQALTGTASPSKDASPPPSTGSASLPSTLSFSAAASFSSAASSASQLASRFMSAVEPPAMALEEQQRRMRHASELMTRALMAEEMQRFRSETSKALEDFTNHFACAEAQMTKRRAVNMASPPPASTSETSAAAAPKSRASYGKGERKRTFHSSHARKFALEVVARDEASGAPTAAVCLFCRHFGREERAGKKRKATANFKYFRNSFRTDLYVQHHQSQHPRQWARYSNCTDEAKRSFFPADATRPAADKQALVKTQDIAEAAAAARASPVESRCWFVLPKRVVDLVTPGGATGAGAEGEQTWQPPAFRACDLVALPVTTRSGAGGQENVHERPASGQTGPNGASGASEKYYRVALFGRMELDVAVDSLAVGLSPRQAARHLHALARRTTGAGGALPSLPLCSAAEMCDLARLAVSESLQLAGQLLTRCWGFGLVLREVTAAPTLSQAGYLDVRVVVYAQGRLRDVHVVALPLFERHAAFALVQTVESVLTAIFPPWRTRLLGI